MSPRTALPPEVDALTRTYLDRVDAALPGHVESLYVVGSTALGAWQPPHSDVDTVIVTQAATEERLRVLAQVHESMPASPVFDGVYLERPLYEARVADRRVVPFVVNGTFRTDRPCGELTPVLWTVLHRHGIAVRGPEPASSALVEDPEALRRYNLDNLRGYWQYHADDVRAQLAGVSDEEPIDAETLVWAVLGPARLHYTLTGGGIVSKHGAAAHVARFFPRWADLADRAARSRRGEPIGATVADLRDAAAAIDAIVDDAWRVHGDGGGRDVPQPGEGS